MKMIIDKNVLLNSLNSVSKALSTRNIIPVLNGIKFELTKEGLYLTATDNDITIQSFIDKKDIVSIDEIGTTIIYGKSLLEIIRRLPNGNIVIENFENNEVSFKTDNSIYSFNCFMVEDFPNINLDEAKIGVIGSSAGGHVAASLALFYDREVYKPVDKADFSSEKEKTWRSAKPAFQILMYPVISMQDERTHSLSQKNLLGENASSQLKDEWSLENHVTKTAPISFLCCAINDKSVNPEGNIIPYWQALRKTGVKTELHVFPASGHGFGVNGASGTARQWQALSITWLETYVK